MPRAHRRLSDADLFDWFNQVDPTALDADAFADYSALLILFLETLPHRGDRS